MLKIITPINIGFLTSGKNARVLGGFPRYRQEGYQPPPFSRVYLGLCHSLICRHPDHLTILTGHYGYPVR